MAQQFLINGLEKCCMDKEQRYELNVLCEQTHPDIEQIKKRIRENPSLLYPNPGHLSRYVDGNESGHGAVNVAEQYLFPLYIAAITPRENTETDLELIKFLIEQALLLPTRHVNFDKGGLLCKGTPDLYPLIALGWRNKFHVLEYLAKRDPPLLNHDDIANVFFKCFYLFDNPGAIPTLLNIFPEFLRNDMNDEIPVLKRFVVHSARTTQDIAIFQTVVETGLRQNPDLDRGVITGDVIQTLVTRKYVVGLNYLRDQDPPLLRPEDVVALDLFACLANSSWTQFTYSADVFLLLLELDPSSIRVRTNTAIEKRDGERVFHKACHYLPIHIFCEYLMDHIESDEQFYRILGMVLGLGMEYEVGGKSDDNGEVLVHGYGGIFEPCNGTIPAKRLYRYIGRMGREDDDNDGNHHDNNNSPTGNHSSILETAMLCETEVDWIHNSFLPNILEDMGSRSARVVNYMGRIPLQYSITTRAMTLGCVLRVLDLDESTIDEIDPLTGLTTSLLAASAPIGYYSIYPKAQLDVIFELMRRYPTLPARYF